MPNRRINGDRVAQLRQTQGHRQTQFATICRLSAGYIREIEKGRAQPSVVVLHRIANALGVDVDQISSVDDTPEIGAA